MGFYLRRMLGVAGKFCQRQYCSRSAEVLVAHRHAPLVREAFAAAAADKHIDDVPVTVRDARHFQRIGGPAAAYTIGDNGNPNIAEHMLQIAILDRVSRR